MGTGWDSAVPIQLQWWPSCSKGDGVTDLWLKKDLLVVTTMAATQHHAPGMPGPGISNRSRSRCISCSDSNASLEDSSLVSTLLPRRARTASVCERIKEGTQTGVVTYFCKSRGHGFIQPSDYQPERGESERSRGGSSAEHFVHVSDVESDFVPLKGDQVSFRLCPVPPKFERCQA